MNFRVVLSNSELSSLMGWIWLYVRAWFHKPLCIKGGLKMSHWTNNLFIKQLATTQGNKGLEKFSIVNQQKKWLQKIMQKKIFLVRSCPLLCYLKSSLPATTFATRKQLLLVDLKEKNYIISFFFKIKRAVPPTWTRLNTPLLLVTKSWP